MKYILTLSERQVKQVLVALDFYSRITCGQLQELKEVGKENLDSEETLIKLQKELFPHLTGLNHSYGIAGKDTPERAKICYDIYKKMMYVFNSVGVYSYNPHAISKEEELPEFVKSEESRMKRQGLNVSINELRELADDLESQTRQFNLELGIDETIDENKRWQINIINKEGLSDTWEIEDGGGNE